MEPTKQGFSDGIFSPSLGFELRPVGQWLRVIDPVNDGPFSIPEEERRARLAAEQRLVEVTEHARHEEQARRAAEERVRHEEQARWAAEERARHEEQSRRAAEERIADLEARLRASDTETG